MNQEMLTSLLRQVLLVIGGWLGLDGLTGDANMLQALAGALAVIIASVWALWSRTDKNIVASAAAKVPVSDKAQKAVGIEKPVEPATAKT